MQIGNTVNLWKQQAGIALLWSCPLSAMQTAWASATDCICVSVRSDPLLATASWNASQKHTWHSGNSEKKVQGNWWKCSIEECEQKCQSSKTSTSKLLKINGLRWAIKVTGCVCGSDEETSPFHQEVVSSCQSLSESAGIPLEIDLWEYQLER